MFIREEFGFLVGMFGEDIVGVGIIFFNSLFSVF